MIRVREFTMAEIEHFCDPCDKSHAKFAEVKSKEMILYSACNQMDGKGAYKTTIGDAVALGTVANETLGYFMARIQMFLEKVGADVKKLRFRQHMANEMAHYACDCWDAEMLTSYGWIECVGCADRSAFDLNQHSKATNVKLCAEKKLDAPRMENVVELQPNKGAIGKAFKKEAKAIMEQLAALDAGQIEAVEKGLEEAGSYDLNGVQLTKDMITGVKRYEKKVFVEEVTPSVIEPSFGVGRIMYSLFEHNFRVRKGKDGEKAETRTFFSLPPSVAPVKCSVLPLSNNPEFAPLVKRLSKRLTEAEVSHKVDDSSGSIGRRYTRTDEVAIPFGVVVDFDSVRKNPASVTVRDRDTTVQVRIDAEDVPEVIRGLCVGKVTWEEVTQKYPIFEQQENK